MGRFHWQRSVPGPTGRRVLTVHLAGDAAELAGRRGVGRIGVSVSRGEGYAAAVAVAGSL